MLQEWQSKSWKSSAQEQTSVIRLGGFLFFNLSGLDVTGFSPSLHSKKWNSCGRAGWVWLALIRTLQVNVMRRSPQESTFRRGVNGGGA